MNTNHSHSTVDVVTDYKNKVSVLSKTKMLSFLFVGALISILIHLNIGFLLSLLLRGGDSTQHGDQGTTIEFAVMDSAEFSELPSDSLTQSQESAASQASEIQTETTQVSLTAESTSTAIQATGQSTAPSLGGGGGGVGAGMGGSGGGGGGTSFFGISSSGSRFCYIVDMSGSMSSGNRMGQAIHELTESIKKLPDFARFYVLFYSAGVREPSIQRGWNTARKRTVDKMIEEFSTIRPKGGTEPMEAFVKAFELKPAPEVIFFLTDGRISGFTTEDLRSLMPKRGRIVINTIAFGSDSSQDLLKEISKMTGGKFNVVQSGGAP